MSEYDTDVFLWSEHQADLLRRVAAGENINDQVAWPNIIEEVETVWLDDDFPAGAKPEEIECLGELYRAGAQDKGLSFNEVVTEALRDTGTITVTVIDAENETHLRALLDDAANGKTPAAMASGKFSGGNGSDGALTGAVPMSVMCSPKCFSTAPARALCRARLRWWRPSSRKDRRRDRCQRRESI